MMTSDESLTDNNDVNRSVKQTTVCLTVLVKAGIVSETNSPFLRSDNDPTVPSIRMLGLCHYKSQ
jgi:hypothetical protein